MASKPREILKAHARSAGTRAHKDALRCSVCSELIAVSLLLAFAFCGLDANLLVVLLECREVLASLAKLTFLHTLPDIPMHKSALAVHEVELVVDAREDFGDSCGVADHAACAHDLRQVATRHDCGWLVVDAALETC